MRRKKFIRIIAGALASITVVSLIIPLARAATVNNSGDFLTVEKCNIQGNVQSWSKLQASYKGALNRNITEFNDRVSKKAGEYELVVSYGRVLVNANWFTNNYYTWDGTARSLLQDSTGSVDQTVLSDFNSISGMAESILAALPQTPDAKNGKVDTSAAFNSPPSEVSDETIIGFNMYQQALESLLNNYIEAGINEVLKANSITFDQSWLLTDGTTSVSQEMVNALSGVRGYLAPYASVYNQVFAGTYGSSIKALIQTEDETDAVDKTVTHKVVGYTRSHKFLDFVSSNLDPEVLTICTWLGTETTTDGTGQTPSEGINAVDLSHGAMEALANAKLIGGEVVPTNSGEYELTELGYYVLAAGLVYDPFTSVAGNDAYMAVLREFMKETDKTEELIRTLQVAINTKKPLYVTDGAVNGWDEESDLDEIDISSYRTARLQDALQDGVRVTRAYVVLEGEMRPSTVDSSTWDYVRGGNGTSSDSGSEAVNSNSDSTSSSATGDVTVGSSVASGAYRVAGSDDLMASGSQVSKPVMYTAGNAYKWFFAKQNASSSLPRRVGGLTTAVLLNAAHDCRDNSYLQRSDREMLFLNGLGDIVLSDGTVVLPAVANPALYDYTTDDSVDSVENGFASNLSDADAGKMSTAVTNNLFGYYPYTATFLNHYPVAMYSESDKVQVANPNDEDKYIVSFLSSLGHQATKIKTSGDKKQVDVNDITTLPCVWLASGALSVREDAESRADAMPLLEMPQGALRNAGHGANMLLGLFSFGQLNVGDMETFGQRYLQTYVGGFNAEGIDYFPIAPPEKDLMGSYMSKVGPLVTSAVRYVGTRDSMNTLSSSGKFRIKVYIQDFMGQGMLGTQYSEQLIKNNQLSYEELVKDQYGRFTRLIKNFTADVLQTVGHIDGVLAIKDGYGNGFFNVMMRFVQEFYVVIAVALFIIIAAKFIKGHFSLFYVAAIGVLCFAAFNVYAVWVPTAVPAIYNLFTNDIVEEVTWNTVATTAEKYQQTYLNSNNKDSASGEMRPYTATLTLYKMTQAEMELAAARLGVDVSQVRKGDILYIDRSAGIYVQGDQIKMSVDSLLANNTMRGLYKSQWEAIDTYGVEDVPPITVDTNTNPYILKLTQPYVSLEAYYTPFCHFERAFLVNLNNFANIFRVERSYYQYPGGLYKDAFLFNAYTNSGIFVAPGDDDVLALSILPDMILGNDLADAGDIIQLCHEHLDPMQDWLGLLSVFSEPNEAMRTSLWGKALQSAGYYNPDWTCDDKQSMMINELVSYIDEQTKQFVIRNQEQLNFLSDENAIKLVTLYATTCFTHKVSSFGYWLYPNYVNAGDIELVDVLYGAMTTYKDRNAALDGDIVNTVVLNLGTVGAILILFITIVSVLFIFILSYLIPILYAMFGALLIYKLVNDEQSIGMLKGYTKVLVTTTVLYMIYGCGLRLVKWGGYQWYGYLMCLIISALCLYFLFFVVLSVVTNPMELGNDVLTRNLFGALDRLTGGRLGNLTSNVLNIRAQHSHGYGAGGYRNFMRSSSVDDRWSGRLPRRGFGTDGFGRYDDFDDGSVSSKVIGRIAGAMGLGGRTNVGYRSTGRRGVFGHRASTDGTGVTGSSWGDRFDNFRHRNRRAS